MPSIPFHIVPLTHPDWETALACARNLGEDALPELRLDLFPDLDPDRAVTDLKRRCVVTCRRADEGGRWLRDEGERLEMLSRAAEARPTWMDLEWDLEIPPTLRAHLTHVRLIRSVHVQPGIFDLGERLNNLPEGDAYKWVGHAGRLADNARVRDWLALARDRRIMLSAFLMGPKGLTSRALQAAWGGAFTFAAPDDGPPSAPGQIPYATMKAWRCARLRPGTSLCGVLGSPVLHSKGPAFHNPRFQAAFKDLIYLPLDCADAEEALEACQALGILGASLTMPLKETLPAALGLEGPLNTLWRRTPEVPWQCANTDAEALSQALMPLAPGPVLVLGGGGVAAASLQVLRALGRTSATVSRKTPMTPDQVLALAPVGLIQATSLGMSPDDPAPFPDLLEAAAPSARWAVEWVYKERTAFATWAEDHHLNLVEGCALFDRQAELQSRRFVEACG